MTILKNDWAPLLGDQFDKPYYCELRALLAEEYKTRTVYPDQYDIFNALHYTGYEATKAVILGQDPYHGPGQAHGLSFSVQPGVAPPPSLQNMYKELVDDLRCPNPTSGCLVPWAERGVLLLNTVLTVRESSPNSHKGAGWEPFTNRVIERLNERDRPVVFILWGSHAQSKTALIDANRHCVLKAPHPSPLSAHRGFFGSKPYSRTNEFLRAIGSKPIDWCLP